MLSFLHNGDVITFQADGDLSYSGWSFCFEVVDSSFFDVIGDCHLLNGNCVSSNNYEIETDSYGPNERCELTFKKDVIVIEKNLIDIEACCDNLIMRELKIYSTNDIPDTFSVGEKIYWKSDANIEKGGWKLCFQDSRRNVFC